MNIINIEHISKIFGGKVIFDDVSCGISEGEKIGVIGINGTGKSTLLKIAAGIEEPDEGQVIRANHIVVRYLPQNPVFDPELSVIDTVLAQSSQNFVGGTSEQNQNAGNHAEHVEHWNLESDAKAMMTKLMQWFCRKSGKSKFTPKDIAAMKATAALKAADRNPYSWNMEFYEYPDGSGYEGRFTKCGICVLMKELGLYDLTPALCHLDYTMSEAGGVTNFVRQYTLASGGPYCDCGYKKKG